MQLKIFMTWPSKRHRVNIDSKDSKPVQKRNIKWKTASKLKNVKTKLTFKRCIESPVKLWNSGPSSIFNNGPYQKITLIKILSGLTLVTFFHYFQGIAWPLQPKVCAACFCSETTKSNDPRNDLQTPTKHLSAGLLGKSCDLPTPKQIVSLYHVINIYDVTQFKENNRIITRPLLWG